MKLFQQGAEIEVVAASGKLRVTVKPAIGWLLMLAEAAFIVWFSRRTVRAWPSMSPVTRVIFAIVEFSVAGGWFYQLSGSEVIEFDSSALTIRKSILGWDRNRMFPLDKCSELERRQTTHKDLRGLQCKVGWRTVRFGDYLSDDQCVDVLKALQDSLPDVARKLRLSAVLDNSHFTTLGLS